MVPLIVCLSAKLVGAPCRTNSATPNVLLNVFRKLFEGIPLLNGSGNPLSSGMASSIMVRAQNLEPDSSKDVESSSVVSGGDPQVVVFI